MYTLCAPVLYRECITDDFPSFASGLRTNENTDQTVRLHINHKRHWAEANYLDILTTKDYHWTGVGSRRHPDDIPPVFDLRSVDLELQALVREGTRIRQFITEGLTILPRLHTVSVGGFCGDIYNGPRAPKLERRLHDDFEKQCKTLPHALLDLPTVKHYCQAVAYGPLSLPNRTIKPKTRIISYTLHQRGTPMFCSCVDCFEDHSPPIILGAINRYYCDGDRLIPSSINPHHYPQFSEYLKPVLAMFARPDVIIADPETGTPIPFQGRINSKSHKGTTVEIYDYFRTVDIGFRTLSDIHEAMSKRSPTYGSLSPQSLSFFQESLDQALPEIWRGKVKLKNREEAPSCQACGFNPQEAFEADLSTSETRTGNCPFGM
jgi:hypothetical protein